VKEKCSKESHKSVTLQMLQEQNNYLTHWELQWGCKALIVELAILIKRECIWIVIKWIQ
jgi:hypothetical protein